MDILLSEEAIQLRIHSVLPHLNEQQRRIYLGAEAHSIGWGGISKISSLSGVCRRSISNGVKEAGEAKPESRIRKKGGGRKKDSEKNPQLLLDIKEIITPHTMGNPENPLVWSSKSIRKVANALQKKGYKISHETVRKSMQELGYSLQSNKKTKEGGTHPDRDAQFEHINTLAKEFLAAGDPVISVDCKKKELIGEYKNNGQEWTPVKNPTEVNVYDFADKANGKASPYGVYDIDKNTGWVKVGISGDTAAFAVSTIRSWWEEEGKNLYPESKRLYINADGGGSNGSRNNLWKEELQQFSDNSNLDIYVSHYPPGTSKWNKIEHRLFAYISKNWRAKPLTSLAVIISLIGATTTTKGLIVKAKLDEKLYPTGIKITKKQIKKWNIERNEFHGEWNYILKPKSK
ncbi:MAG: ISAzo13 family transposase [Oscillospiraceae bacterium]|nr:ISAzo13 family transposase [Oscillospiraceae bacterium]